MAAPLSCEASSSPRPGEPGAGSICPDCVAGGETTDFSGDVSCSTRSLTPVQRDSAIAREFDADAVIARLERPLLTSFGWRRGPGGSVATGYERETQAQIRVEERPFTLAEAQGAAEAFVTAASAFVTPVVEIDGRTIGDGRPGPVTRPQPRFTN